MQGISIIDSDGDEYFRSSSVSTERGQTAIKFDVDSVEDDDDPLPATLVVDTARSVNVSYTATVRRATVAGPTSAPPTDAATPITTARGGAGPSLGERVRLARLLKCSLALVAVALFT